MFELPLVVCKFLELSNSLRMYLIAVCFKYQKNLLVQWKMKLGVATRLDGGHKDPYGLGVCTSGFVDDVIFPHKDPYGLGVGNIEDGGGDVKQAIKTSNRFVSRSYTPAAKFAVHDCLVFNWRLAATLHGSRPGV